MAYYEFGFRFALRFCEANFLGQEAGWTCYREEADAVISLLGDCRLQKSPSLRWKDLCNGAIYGLIFLAVYQLLASNYYTGA